MIQDPHALRERFVRLASAAIFLIFFQTYMVAPLIPSLAIAMHASEEKIGLLVPAYTLPYAVAGLLCGGLSDRVGRRGLFFLSLAGFPLCSALMALAPSIDWLLAFRALSGFCNAGVVVMAITLVGDRFPMSERGHALGWIFGAIAGGSAFGSTLAGLLDPLIGWRGLFILTAVASLFLLRLFTLWQFLLTPVPATRPPLSTLVTGYLAVLRNVRAARTYLFIFLNGCFHSGVFTWLGVHLHDRYHLGPTGIGLALLGYGIPGFLLGPSIGHLADRHGRRLLVPAGFAVAALSAFLFIPHTPLFVAILAAPILSLGFDMSHPLLAGIVTGFDERRRGQAVGLNAFAIFAGFGTGAILFGRLATHSLPAAFLTFAVAELLIAAAAYFVFQKE